MHPKELRLAVEQTIRNNGPLPLRKLATLVPLQTTYDAVANTVENAVRYGHLEKVGSEKLPHCNKWVALYDLPNPDGADHDHVHDGGMVVLSGALSHWR